MTDAPWPTSATDASVPPRPSTPVLATKLFAPARRADLVARLRLVERLDATLGTGHRLTLVSAPAGFGKTTAVSDWLTHLEGRDSRPRAGWLSLDEGDNDVTRFLAHVLAALRSVGLDLPERVLLDVTGSDALTVLLNDLEDAGRQAPGERCVLFLDDYHVIESPDVHAAVTFLLDHLPHLMHLVIATRSDPPLPLARLRTGEQLTEVRAADLRFTGAEAAEFLTQVMGLDLGTADVHALEGRTEGWIAGLQLAALSLRGLTERADVAGFIDAFAGSDRFVLDYLADEVLTRLPAGTHEFLLHTAVLDRLTGSLCDAVTGRDDATWMLADLERANLFLVPLDTRRSWYRYHHLFADVLRARLLAEHADQVPELHRRASTWHASHDLVEDAVRHALAAEDFGAAARLVEQAMPELRRGRQDGLLLGWGRSLPDSVVRPSPVHAGRALDLAGPEGPPSAWGRSGLPRLGRLGVGGHPQGAVGVHRGRSQPARGRQPGRRAGQHGGARRHVGGIGSARARPRPVRAGPADRDR